MSSPFLVFVVGGLVCFLGTVPFGPINLAVVKTTVDLDQRRGSEMALAAAIVEIGMVMIALCFGFVISSFLEANVAAQLLIAVAFVGLAGIIATRKPDPRLETGAAEARRAQSFFVRGLLIAAVNPQAIPFWIFALTAIDQYLQFEYEGIYLLAFLTGVFAGKLTALYGFVIASGYLKSHLAQSSLLVNRVLAGVLLLIGVSQIWRASQVLFA